jgi:DNA-binding HxlR family transcriptional regulator
MSCPIARTLEIVGEWWTLLIIRDALLGSRRFEEFRQIGIADNILSARLELLVREGILERKAYQEHPLRYEYLLTEKGRDLLPVIASMGRWGIKWTGTTSLPPQFLHTRCGSEIGLDLLCANCGVLVPPDEIRLLRRGGLGATTAEAEPDADAREAALSR